MSGHINYTDGLAVTGNSESKLETFIAAGTITAGQAVVFDNANAGSSGDGDPDVTRYVEVGTTGALVVGIAAESATVGNPIRVWTKGYVDGVTCASATYAYGDALKLGASGALTAYGSTALVTPPIAYAVEAGSSLTDVAVIFVGKFTIQ